MYPVLSRSLNLKKKKCEFEEERERVVAGVAPSLTFQLTSNYNEMIMDFESDTPGFESPAIMYYYIRHGRLSIHVFIEESNRNLRLVSRVSYQIPAFTQPFLFLSAVSRMSHICRSVQISLERCF